MTLQSCPTWRQEGRATQWIQAALRDEVVLFHLACDSWERTWPIIPPVAGGYSVLKEGSG